MNKTKNNSMRCMRLLLFASVFISFSYKPASVKPVTIYLQPFSDLNSKYTIHVYKELKKLYPNVICLKARDLPASAYYKPRNRYRADSLLSILKRKTANGSVTIGLTSKDISTTKGNIKDYGVMGLGYQPGRACVVSTFRLAKKNLSEQLFKVSIHELGHTQGLPHCPVKSCFMRDAEGENHNDEEHEFCTKCRTHLEQRGWNFK